MEAERKKERKAKAPSSKKRKGDERFDEAIKLAKKLRKIEDQVAKGDAEPEELWRVLAELPPWMAEVSESLGLKQAKARERLGLPSEEVATEADSIPNPPERPWKVPKSISELPDIEGRFFERAHEIGDPDQLAADFLNTVGEQYRFVSTKTADFAQWLMDEGIVGGGVSKSDVENALRHFLAAYSITREFGSPRLTWDLGALNELIISPVAGWWGGQTKKEIEADTEIDYYHNQLGIEEAVRASGKDVPLYELVRRLAKEGRLHY